MDRGLAAAVRLGDPALAGFAGLAHAGAFSRLGARRTASAVLAEARAIVALEADRTGEDVRGAEALGMTHLAEAADLAHATGERNTLQWHFGPANVAARLLALAVKRGNGPSHAERLEAHPITPMSAGRSPR